MLNETMKFILVFLNFTPNVNNFYINNINSLYSSISSLYQISFNQKLYSKNNFLEEGN